METFAVHCFPIKSLAFVPPCIFFSKLLPFASSSGNSKGVSCDRKTTKYWQLSHLFLFFKDHFNTMEYQDVYFNIDHGYLEGLVRGFKSGILKQGDYLNLVQCESLEGKFSFSPCSDSYIFMILQCDKFVLVYCTMSLLLPGI